MIHLPSGRIIGTNQPIFIVAEVGSNWQTLDDCLMSIRSAKNAGADAVKFQLYDFCEVYGLSWDSLGPMQNELPRSWLPQLKAQADSVGIEFMCSAFSPELIDAVDPFVAIHKVASAECTHKRMLEKLHKINKPVILSTGAHGMEDVRASLSVLKDTPTILLYCVASYPARLIDFPAMMCLRDEFGKPTGYSDHSTDALVVPHAAMVAGACVIEKHVNFTDHTGTPDAPHSLSEREFRAMVARLRHSKDDGRFAAGPEENAMIARHNRRLIATRDIQAGDMFATDGEPFQDPKLWNFGIYRSLKDDAHGFHPFMVDEVKGRFAKRDIKAGDGIGPGDV